MANFRGACSFFLGMLCYFALLQRSTNALLHRRTVLNATQKFAVCNDGADAIYYFERTNSRKWIIFLESGGSCFDYNSCLSRKSSEPYLFGTGLYPRTVQGEDILSPSKEKNFLYQHNKILIPYCSSDLWLGNNTVNLANGGGGKSDISFRGSAIFRAIVNELRDNYGMRNASEVWLGGSSAGGIGVINHVQYIRRTLQATVYVMTDSAWFLNYQNMLSSDKIVRYLTGIDAREIPACSDTTLGYPCCLSIFCMITRNYIAKDVHVFNLISRHDIYALSRGIMLPGKLTSSGKTRKIISDMLSFGGEISHSVRLTKSFSNVRSIITSCIQHTYLATSSLWSPGALFHARSQTTLSFPLFVFRHSVKKGRWKNVVIEGEAINKILQNWYVATIILKKRNGSERTDGISSMKQDSCGGVQCNPTCPKSIILHTSEYLWPTWAQWVILSVYLVFTVLCLIIKLIWTAMRIRETRIQNEFVSSLYESKTELNAIGLPSCIPANYIGLSCSDVEYEVTIEKTKRSSTPNRGFFMNFKSKQVAKTEKKKVLKDINAYFNPGQLVAIMGPSGSGKTTLLDILTGRRDSENSQVFINGFDNNETREWFKRHSGYVLQLATPYHEELTVRENLTFSAIMRLPKTMSTRNKLMRVEQVIGQSGLNDYADVVVGSSTGPGLSGGQKRRLCVAIQLLRVPSVLFLDEPTSGLDSASSLELLETLHGLTLSGRLVILTIHQPRIEIFHMFDRILFLSNGKVAYFGSPLMAPTMIAEALKNSGEVFDASNPADTIMDVLINKKSQEMIVDHYEDSGEIEAIKTAVSKAAKNPLKALSMKIKRYPSSILERLLAFDCRASKCQTRAQKLYLLIIFLLYGLALGSVYWQTNSGILLMSCYQVFLCASQLFMASVIHAYFNKAVPVFTLEQAEGVGKSFELVIHCFIRISALTVLPLFICCAIIYLCTVTNLDPWKFFVTTLIHMQLNHVWIAIIMLSACAVPKYSTLICPLLSAVSGFSGGFLVPKPKMPAFYYWLFYINPTHWAYSGIMKILMDDVIFDCKTQSRLQCESKMGMAILQQFGFDNVNSFEDMVILTAMLIVFLCTTMILMEFKYTNKITVIRRSFGRLAQACRKSTPRCSRSRSEHGDETKRLVENKDIEANGNCITATDFAMKNFHHTKNTEMASCEGETRNRSRSLNNVDDVIPLLMPVKVDPMLTARVSSRPRPQTISVMPSIETNEGLKKRSVPARSSSFTYTQRPAQYANIITKQVDKNRNTQSLVPVPHIVLIKDEEDVSADRRSRSDSEACLSKYLDTTLKTHEVYCSVSSGRPKSSRKRSIAKRLPDNVKRSESVHIQRKATMLILAEKRKSFTAQITGFGQTFTYLNEVYPERKPQPRKQLAIGAKRKVEIKRQHRGSDCSGRDSVASIDLLKVPDVTNPEELTATHMRRSRLCSQQAIDVPDNVETTTRNLKADNESTHGEPNVQYLKPMIPVNATTGVGYTRTMNNKSSLNDRIDENRFEPSGNNKARQESFVSRRQQPLNSRKAEKQMAEPVKVSALKISRRKFVPLREPAEVLTHLPEKFDVESRSSACRTPLGSIDELEEDVKDSSGEEERARGKKPARRKTSLSKAQQQNNFSENFSEITKWLRQSSRALNEGDELSDCESKTKSCGEDSGYHAEFKAVGNTTSETDNGVIGVSIAEDDIDEEISRAFSKPIPELVRPKMFSEKLQKSALLPNFTSLLNPPIPRTRDFCKYPVKKPPLPMTNLNITVSTPSPKTFSNALFVASHGSQDSFVDIDVNENSSISARCNDFSRMVSDTLAVKRDSWETRSNEELTSERFTNRFGLEISETPEIQKRKGSRNKCGNIRRSNSFEFDLDSFDTKKSTDIVKVRSFRRKRKKQKMETSEGDTFKDDRLNETVI